MPNFAEIASKKMSEIERPPLAPMGNYVWVVTSQPVVSKSGDELWEIVTFNCRALEALDDVDMSDYKGDVKTIVNSVKFMFNTTDEVEFAKSEFRLKQFLENHLGVANEGDSMAEALNASVNAQFTGTLVHRADKNDPEVLHTNISRTAPVV